WEQTTGRMPVPQERGTGFQPVWEQTTGRMPVPQERGTGFQPVSQNLTGKMPVPRRWARLSRHPKGRRPRSGQPRIDDDIASDLQGTLVGVTLAFDPRVPLQRAADV